MFNKNLRRKRIRQRIRKKMTGTGSRPRMSVFRSNKSIYCQLIDDVHGKTLISASSKENDIEKEGSKVEQAKKVGKLIGEKAQSQKITEVVLIEVVIYIMDECNPWLKAQGKLVLKFKL